MHDLFPNLVNSDMYNNSENYYETFVSQSMYPQSGMKANKEIIEIDKLRDNLFDGIGATTVKENYAFRGESPQEMYARVAAYLGTNKAHAQRLYNYMSKHWWSPASPFLSNTGTDRGLVISCFLREVEDSMESISDMWHQQTYLASKGGGVGTYWGNVRSAGEKISDRGVSSGIIPFMKVEESINLAINQGGLRRANSAVYLPIDHPEIEDFISMRKLAGGDPNRKMKQLNHGILVYNKFMRAVKENKPYDLISPKDKSVRKTIDARKLWIDIMNVRIATGEPYLVFIDTVREATPQHHKILGLYAKTSNLCVAPETKILTDKGYKTISKLRDKKVNVWNGSEWSKVTVQRTATNAKLITVKLSNGMSLDCTPQHKFYLQNGYGKNKTNKIEVRAIQLKTGDKLIRPEKMPVAIDSKKKFKYAYAHGFYCGDGFLNTRNKRAEAWLYNDKHLVADRLRASGPCIIGNYNENSDKSHVYFAHDMQAKFKVPVGYAFTDKLDWLAGLIDSDGCSTNNQGNQSIQISSINTKFLRKTLLLLQELGISAKISKMHSKAVRMLPDGTGGMQEYQCQASYRLLIPYGGVQALLKMGLKTERVKLKNKHKANRRAEHFVRVVKVIDKGRIDDTYCFSEPKKHMGMFNGVLTGQCAEIVLPTGLDMDNKRRTAVCCLSSVNVEKWDEWKDDKQFIRDSMEFLDNGLSDFCEKAKAFSYFDEAIYSALQERSVGLGMMGFHSYLQSKNIPFESAVARSLNKRMFKHLREGADKASVELAELRGACPDAKRVGFKERFSYKIACAPTATISIITGNTSPSFELFPANIYQQKTLAGWQATRNKHLINLLNEKEKNTDEVWQNISEHAGSVQQLDFLSDWEKQVFKTALETDQNWVIEMAADRQVYIDQSQAVNIFLPPDTDKKTLNKIHFTAWEKGVKSLYYLRSQSLKRAESVSSNVETYKSDDTSNETMAASNGSLPKSEEVTCMGCQ